MGAAARRHTVTARLLRDRVVVRADAALAAATNAREAAEQVLAVLAKPGGGSSKKKGADGREVNRGFVERAMNKLDANDHRAVKRTPGVTRLMDMIGLKHREGMQAAEIVKASRAYLAGETTTGTGENNSEDAALLAARRHAKRAVAAAGAREAAVAGEVERLRSRAARRMWSRARVVACTASSAVDVNARLSRDLAEHDDDDDDDDGVGGASRRREDDADDADDDDDGGVVTFPYVILDEVRGGSVPAL